MGRVLAAFVAMSVVLATPSSATAKLRLASSPSEPTPPTEAQNASKPRAAASREAFERGLSAFEQGDHAAALLAFEEAARLRDAPVHQYHIGRCHEALGHAEPAIFAYRAYLSLSPWAANRAEVEARLARLRGRPTLAKPRATSPTTREPRHNDGRGLVIAGGSIIAGSLATALTGATVFGVLAARRSQSLERVTEAGNPREITFAGAQALHAEGERFERRAALIAGIGVAVAMGGLVMLAIGLHRKRHPSFARAFTCTRAASPCIRF